MTQSAPADDIANGLPLLIDGEAVTGSGEPLDVIDAWARAARISIAPWPPRGAHFPRGAPARSKIARYLSNG